METVNKKTIMVVDDDLDTVEIIRMKLEAAGFKVVTARDGYECVAKCQEIEPDLLIVDVMMPKISGFKVVKLLKSDEQLKDMPIIILTARVQKADRQLARDIQANGYITKPFSPEGILREVKQLLNKEA
jgi:CheY-like chemotaxis protein|tara:strand:- start:969 stop:1355 length:387 start_codon:yes stop_codon:yes gene_type:complete